PSAGRARSLSPEHHVRAGEVVVELDPRQAFERLDVARARAGDDIVRKLRARIGLVPAERLAVVAHELLVERRLRATGAVPGGRPEPRRVRCERLVAEHQLTALVETELELRVRE